jgi:triacylglycerol lipase
MNWLGCALGLLLMTSSALTATPRGEEASASSSRPFKDHAMTAETRNPVILVHGFKDTGRKLEWMARHLRREGWDVRTVTLSPSWGQVGIDVLAKQLDDFIRTNFCDDQPLDLVGFSMGGLVCRYYVQRLGGLTRIRRLVTISTPHNGSQLAHLLRNTGCRQMVPNSEFLRDLNRDADTLARLQFTSVWTPLDLMILPARSSHMSVGNERRLWVIAHPLMVFQRNCIRAVAEILRT